MPLFLLRRLKIIFCRHLGGQTFAIANGQSRFYVTHLCQQIVTISLQHQSRTRNGLNESYSYFGVFCLSVYRSLKNLSKPDFHITTSDLQSQPSQTMVRQTKKEYKLKWGEAITAALLFLGIQNMHIATGMYESRSLLSFSCRDLQSLVLD